MRLQHRVVSVLSLLNVLYQAILPMMLPHLIVRLTDPEYRVGLGACEALYNIARVVRGAIVPYVPRILEALYNLAADRLVEVQQSVLVLDRLMMDLVCETRQIDLSEIVQVNPSPTPCKDPPFFGRALFL